MYTKAACILVIISLCASLPSPTAMAAVNRSVSGVVKDAQTGDALVGANVVLVGTSLGASTDKNGAYTIANVPPGSYTVRATYIGYKTVELSLQVGEATDVKRDFTLQAVALEGETVVVTAQALGQNQAINQQLAADQIVNVVSAARIQELPDPNAAESVGRLPGVSLIRNGGEGTQVVVRGLQPKYNTVMVDGVRMASSNPNDRSIDLSMISPNMLAGIEVSKTVTPDQDADVLGGTVNFRMREATGEGREGLGFNLLVQGGYNGLSNAPNKYNNYKYVGSIDGRFLDDRFGVFAQADLERRNLTSNELGASYSAIQKSQIDYTINSLNLADIPRDRRRTNGTVVLDYVLPQGSIRLTNFISSGVTDVHNRGEAYNVPLNQHNYSFAYSNSELTLLTNSLTFEHQLPIFHLNANLSHTYSETKNPFDWTVRFQQASVGLSPFVGQPNPNPQTIPPAATTAITGTTLTALTINSSFARERAFTGSLDLDAPITFSDVISAVVKFGGKYRYQKRSYIYDQYTGQGLGLTSANFVDNLIVSHFPVLTPYANTTSIPMAPFVDQGFKYGKFLKGAYPMRTPLSYGMLADMAGFVLSQAPLLAQRSDPAFFHDNFNSTTNDYLGHEDQSAMYIMATINVGPEITLIPGVRYQNLKTTYTASRGQQNTSSALGGPYRYYDTTLSVSHGYWLPDVSLRYKPFSWFDLRLSYTNTIAYPDYNAIIPRIDMAIGNSIAWNNYRLVPSRSTNYDAYVSFYDNSIGLFTVGGFLKRISNLIYQWSFNVSGASALPYFVPNMGATVPSGTYSISTYINNPYRIDNWGIELDWQTHFWYLPHPFDGLVLNANYTHIFSKAEYPYTLAYKPTRGPIQYIDTSFTERLLFQPDNIVNLTLGYDYKDFSARVSLLYQADIFTGSPGYFSQLATSTAAYTRWDVSVKQGLPWFGLQIFGDLYNLNGVSDISVLHAPTGVPQSEQSYGLTADLGLRWQF